MLPGGEPTPVLLVGDMPTTAPLLRFMRYMPLATRSRSRLISGAYASHTRSAEAASSMRSFIRSCRGEHYLINLNPRIYGLGGARGRRWSELARHLGRSAAQSTTKRNVGGYRDDASYRQEEHDARVVADDGLEGHSCGPVVDARGRGTTHAIFSLRDHADADEPDEAG